MNKELLNEIRRRIDSLPEFPDGSGYNPERVWLRLQEKLKATAPKPSHPYRNLAVALGTAMLIAIIFSGSSFVISARTRFAATKQSDPLVNKTLVIKGTAIILPSKKRSVHKRHFTSITTTQEEAPVTDTIKQPLLVVIEPFRRNLKPILIDTQVNLLTGMHPHLRIEPVGKMDIIINHAYGNKLKTKRMFCVQQEKEPSLYPDLSNFEKKDIYPWKKHTKSLFLGSIE